MHGIRYFRGLTVLIRQIALYVCLDAFLHIIRIGLFKYQARDPLVELDIAVGNPLDKAVGHDGHELPLQALESIGHEPFADEFLG